MILIVDNSRAVTGALNAMRHATGPLQLAGELQFEYVLPAGSTGRTVLEDDGYAVHELPFVEISRRKKDLLLYVPMLLLNGWRLARLARRRGAGIVHLNDFYNLTGYVAKFLSLNRLRVITHVRFLPQTQVQPLARTWRWLAETLAEQVLCVSEAVRMYFGPATHVQVVYDPLPGQELHSIPVVPQSRLDGTVCLLYLSNYIRGKGQNFALEAFRIAYARDSRLRLHFVGGDMGMPKNKEFRHELEVITYLAGLTEVVRFSGFAADTEAAMKAHDIVLNFSEAESFSLTCLDALYYGVPLIASDCGGPAELFESGLSGLLVPNRDVSAMANAIMILANSIPLRRQLSQASRLFVRQKFSSVHTYHRLADCYRRTIARS